MKKNYYFLIILILFATFFYIPRASAHTLIRIFASDAVSKPLRIIGNIFEKEHRGVKIDYEFSASGVFRVGILGGVPPDIYITSNEKYQGDLMERAAINSYKVFAYDYLAAATPYENPAGVNESNLISKLMNENVSLTIASPNFSPAGYYTIHMFKTINKKTPGAFNKIVGHANQLLSPALIIPLLKNGKTDIGILYASQAAGLKKERTGINIIQIPAQYNTKAKFTISILNRSPYHFVSPMRKKLDKEFKKLLLSKTGQKTLKQWGFSPV
ncbi:MAG: extracellular solute-binding protein [Candidatus Acididesulfobacter diazotrophicus]|jgi:molybdate transport system substrate-binding protein|uniref:Extracellular solute-binding protein n=1 Tax=Candidatus Acididesulfobacter diazotrophicus TaxID=2597226 RepID=A0A519BNV1_9DELT|nr:MAG: extracellular solute-binding protein [Candidatus Acididesulfobacter diazotrophicus]